MPRIAPAEAPYSPAIATELERIMPAEMEPLILLRTMARSPRVFGKMFAGGLLDKGPLSLRQREIVILRIGYLCRSGYEWAQHVRIGLDAGLTEGEVSRIKYGPAASAWEERDRAMLRAVDDLTSDFFVSSKNWDALTFLTDRQKMDLVLTVGQYTQVSMLLNSFGVQPEPDLALDPDVTDYEAAA